VERSGRQLCNSTAYINGQPFWGYVNPTDADRLNPRFADDSLYLTWGDGWYNALEVQVTKRATHGLTFQSSYTYSKNDGTPTGEADGQDISDHYSTNPINVFQDKGPNELNLSQQWKFNVLYHVPPINISNGFLSKLVNGWWTASIVSLQTGFNISPTYASSGNYDLNNETDRPDVVTAANVAAVRAGTYMRDGVLGGMNPNAVPYNASTVITGGVKPVYVGGTDPTSQAACAATNQVAPCFTQYGWFNPNMFIPPPAGFLGNASRGMLVGPGLFNWDFSLVKDTPIRERYSLQFRAEFFNVLNRPNFGAPNGVTFDSSPIFASPCNPSVGCGAGIITGASVINPSAGLIINTGTNSILNSRQIQFGLRFEF